MVQFRGLSVVAVGLVGALALAGCGSFSDSTAVAGGGAGDQRIVADVVFTPKSAWALETDDAFVLSQVGCLETLVKYDYAAGKLVPMLATEWKQSTPTTWDFTLRQNVKFQDGTTLTADAVVGALTRLLKADAPPRAFSQKDVSSVAKLDERTVRITTPQPSVLLPFRLAAVNTGILSPAAFTAKGVVPFKHCTGPFTPVKEVPRQSLTLDRNTDYWGGKVALAGAEVRFTPEGSTRATQIQTGESQISLTLPSSTLSGLKGNSKVKLLTVDTPRTTSLYFNNSKAPFNDIRVRRALRQALNLSAIATDVYNGAGVPAAGAFGAADAWAPSGGVPVAQDATAAKAALAEAGIAPGTLKVSLLAYTERAELSDLAAVVQENLKKIGVEVSIKVANYVAVEPDLLSGKYDMALVSRSYLIDIGDPIGFLTSDYSCKGTYNLSHFCDKAVDAKLSLAAAESDASKRYALYGQIDSQLQSDAVDAFLVQVKNTDATTSAVKNYATDPLNRYTLTAELDLNK